MWFSESAAYIRTEPKQKPTVSGQITAVPGTSDPQQHGSLITQPSEANNIVDYDQLRHYFKVGLKLNVVFIGLGI